MALQTCSELQGIDKSRRILEMDFSNLSLESLTLRIFRYLKTAPKSFWCFTVLREGKSWEGSIWAGARMLVSDSFSFFGRHFVDHVQLFPASRSSFQVCMKVNAFWTEQESWLIDDATSSQLSAYVHGVQLGSLVVIQKIQQIIAIAGTAIGSPSGIPVVEWTILDAESWMTTLRWRFINRAYQVQAMDSGTPALINACMTTRRGMAL